MEFNLQKLLGTLLGLLSVLALSDAVKDKALYCGACLALVEEINQSIAMVDPKKKIQIGSFRIDAKGNQDLREVSYGRSDLHLSEQFDNVCRKMHNYGLVRNEDPRKKVYIRKYAADGTLVSSDSANFDDEVGKNLEYACEEIVQNFEEDMTPYFKEKSAETEKQICVGELEFCTADAVTDKLWAQASAVMAGMKEKADEAKREAEGDTWGLDGDDDEPESYDDQDAFAQEAAEEYGDDGDDGDDGVDDVDDGPEMDGFTGDAAGQHWYRDEL